MTVVLGTNAGFVTTAPTADPHSSAAGLTGTLAIQFTTPSGCTEITEMGTYSAGGPPTTSAEFAIYEDDTGAPGDMLGTAESFSYTSGAGWKKVTGLSITVSASTTYWLALQTDGQINYDYASTGATYAGINSTSTLADPFGTPDSIFTRMVAIYGLYVSSGTDYTEDLSETMTVGDSLSDSSIYNRTISDTLTTSDSLSKTSIFNIALSETFNLADSLTSVADYNRLLDDIQTIQDNLSSSQGFTVLLTELQNITDSLSSEAQYNRNLDDTITMTDSLVDTLAVLARVYKEIILKLKDRRIPLSLLGKPITLKSKDKRLNI